MVTKQEPGLVGVYFRVLNESDRAAAEQVLLSAFLNEPCGVVLGFTEGDWVPFIGGYLDECVRNGLSVAAFDEATQELLGLCINYDYAVIEEENIKVSDKFKPMLELLLQVEEPYNDLLKELGMFKVAGKVFHIMMLGVRQDPTTTTTPGRRGIGQALAKRSVELAREKNFDRCLVETSGAFSYRCFNRLGFQEYKSVFYKEYEKPDSKQRILESVPPPHDRFALQQLIL